MLQLQRVSTYFWDIMLIDHNFGFMKFVKLMLKIWPELMVLLGFNNIQLSGLVADVNNTLTYMV